MKNLPAFPTVHDTDYNGMSLRDYFAAQVAGHIWQAETAGYRARGAEDMVPTDKESFPCWHEVAKYAYAMADAMLIEREKGNSQ